MFYALIVLALVLMVVIYLRLRTLDNPKERLRRRRLRLKPTKFDVYVVNRPGVLFAASLVVAMVGLSIVFSAPGPDEEANRRRAEELAWAEAIGRRLGAELAPKVKSPTKALVFDLDTGKNTAYHDALVAGLRDGLGAKCTGVVEVAHPPSAGGPSPAEQLAASRTIELGADLLDLHVEKNADCGIVVSLIGLPDDYALTQTCANAKSPSRELAVGVLTPSVYAWLSYFVDPQAPMVDVALLPKQSYVVDATKPREVNVDHRYLVIEPAERSDLKRLIRENQRIFRVDMEL